MVLSTNSQLWYQLSKILAENAAWDFSKEHGIDMIAINPRMVIGPFLQPSATLNAKVILSLVNGMLLILDFWKIISKNC
nr:tetraketide alpha-pyrone reductase 1-like [Coffea arabica]